MYHFDLYNNKNGNASYAVKIFGDKSDPVDKYIFGGLITGVILTLLIGPFIFFSEWSTFIEPNPVQNGVIEIVLNINKTVSLDQIMNEKTIKDEALNANVKSETKADVGMAGAPVPFNLNAVLSYEDMDGDCIRRDKKASEAGDFAVSEDDGAACRDKCNGDKNCHGFEYYKSSTQR